MSAELFIDDKVQVIETGLVGVVVGVHGEFSVAVTVSVQEQTAGRDSYS